LDQNALSQYAQQRIVTNPNKVEQEFNPFINPADPTHSNLNVNKHAAEFSQSHGTPQQTTIQQQPRRRQQAFPQLRKGQQQTFHQHKQQFQQQRNPAAFPQQQTQRQSIKRNQGPPPASSVPACADCDGLNPFINPADFSHLQGYQQTQQPLTQQRQTYRQSGLQNPSFTQGQQTFQQPIQQTSSFQNQLAQVTQPIQNQTPLTRQTYQQPIPQASSFQQQPVEQKQSFSNTAPQTPTFRQPAPQPPTPYNLQNQNNEYSPINNFISSTRASSDQIVPAFLQ